MLLPYTAMLLLILIHLNRKFIIEKLQLYLMLISTPILLLVSNCGRVAMSLFSTAPSLLSWSGKEGDKGIAGSE